MNNTLPEKIILNIGPSKEVHTPLPVIHQELRLVDEDDPVLCTPCLNAPVGILYRNQNESLIECMLKVCETHNGYGLSANQLGVSMRLFVLYTSLIDHMKDDFAFFNPEIVATSPDLDVLEEGCLSLPYITQKVKRPSWIILQYQDINGTKKTQTFYGITARVVCHEMDHLSGKTLFDHMSPMEKRRAKERRSKKMKTMKRHSR